MKIILNRCKCLKCGDIITSRHVHDFVMCGCGHISTDGGTEYVKRSGDIGDIEDLSEYEDDIKPMEMPAIKELTPYNWATVSTSAKIVHCPFCGRASMIKDGREQNFNCSHLWSITPSDTGLVLVEYRHPNPALNLADKLRIERNKLDT